MSKPLFEEDSASDEEFGIGTNKEYAKQYNKFRQKELLKKLKDKEGGGSDDSGSSSDSDSSDDDEEVFNPKFDAKFYETLSSLKKKDPKIYDKEVNFFGEIVVDTKASGTGTSKKQKALTVKEYEQKILLENDGIYDDADEENANERQRPLSPSYHDEQARIKNEFHKVLQDDSDDDEGGEWGGIFKKREKTSDAQKEEDAEHEKWLAENADVERAKAVQDVWANRKLTKDDIFLRDYILSNGYANKDDDEIPTYDEIVGDSEDDFDVKQAEFEQKYNFRFEEPDQEFIKRYPRTIENSVRKTDDRRKQKRVEVRERKEHEKQEKLREIEMLNELERKDIEEKIEKLKAVTGHENLDTDLMDLDGDFDPEQYDKKMQDIFNSEYYGVDEGEDKPECPSDIEDLKVENYDEYDPEEDRAAGAHCEDEDFNMDCDYESAGPSQLSRQRALQQELIENTRDKRKRRKRKSKFMEMFESKRPSFNPEDEKTYGEYLDEYYKLDCEDIIGDVKCRFKYVETTPNDFGLSVEEILLAKNKELNAWASLKKATQIRPDHIEKKEQAIFQRKARNEALKKKILASLYDEPSDEEPEVSTNVSKPVVFQTEQEKELTEEAAKEPDPENKKKKKKKKNGNKSEAEKSSALHDSSEATATSTVSEEPAKAAPTEPVIDQTSAKIIVQKTATEAKNTVKRTLDSLPSHGKAKVKPMKPSASVGPSKPAKIKFDKNFVKKPQPSTKSAGLTDERLKAFGINPRRYNWKLKHATSNDANNLKPKPIPGGNKRPINNKKFKSPNGQSAPPKKKQKFQ